MNVKINIVLIDFNIIPGPYDDVGRFLVASSLHRRINLQFSDLFVAFVDLDILYTLPLIQYL